MFTSFNGAGRAIREGHIGLLPTQAKVVTGPRHCGARAISLEEAKRLYLQRFTMEHVPYWARQPRVSGGFYAPAYRSDLDWYQRTVFPGEPGHVGPSNYCHSQDQQWPLGLELLTAYEIGKPHPLPKLI